MIKISFSVTQKEAISQSMKMLDKSFARRQNKQAKNVKKAQMYEKYNMDSKAVEVSDRGVYLWDSAMPSRSQDRRLSILPFAIEKLVAPTMGGYRYVVFKVFTIGLAVSVPVRLDAFTSKGAINIQLDRLGRLGVPVDAEMCAFIHDLVLSLTQNEQISIKKTGLLCGRTLADVLSMSDEIIDKPDTVDRMEITTCLQELSMIGALESDEGKILAELYNVALNPAETTEDHIESLERDELTGKKTNRDQAKSRLSHVLTRDRGQIIRPELTTYKL